MGYKVTILYLQSFLVYLKYHVAYSIENLKQILIISLAMYIYIHAFFSPLQASNFNICANL